MFKFTPAFKETHNKFSTIASMVNRAAEKDSHNKAGLEDNLRTVLLGDKMPIQAVNENLANLCNLVRGGYMISKRTEKYLSAE